MVEVAEAVGRGGVETEVLAEGGRVEVGGVCTASKQGPGELEAARGRTVDGGRGVSLGGAEVGAEGTGRGGERIAEFRRFLISPEAPFAADPELPFASDCCLVTTVDLPIHLMNPLELRHDTEKYPRIRQPLDS